VSEPQDQAPDAVPTAPGTRPPAALLLLTVLLSLEAAVLWAVSVWQVFELLTDRPASFASAVAILVILVIAALWVTAMAVGVLRRRPWIRGAAVTWQLVQLAVGVGMFQGADARPDLGWALVVPAVVVIALLFTPGVVAAMARQSPEH
jgi:phosphoglycerol transferase MdoB-like AlkP superfamily enzyme